MNEIDETTWRNRFILINVTRIGATVLVLVGILIWQTDMARAGGLPELGIPMMLIGLLGSFGAPKLLASRWRTPPSQ